MPLHWLLGKKVPGRKKSPEINIWRLQAILHNFRKILQLNNNVLEEMAELERTLSGEFIFDQNYLTASVRRLASRVHHITYHLNALTANSYIPLYDAYQHIRTVLDDILSGSSQTFAVSPVLPLDSIGWELEPLVGINLVCLAELRNHPGIQAGGGLVITAPGCRALARGDTQPGNIGLSSEDVGHELCYHLRPHLSWLQPPAFSVVLTRIDGETEPVREVGHYIVQPNDTGQNVIVVPYHLAENVAYQFASDHSSKPVESEQWEKLYLGAISSVICQASRSNRRENLAPPEIVAYLRPAAAVTTSGMIATGGCTGNKNDCMVISAQERTDERLSDQYFIRRTYPFSLLESRLAPRGIGYRFLDGKRATDRPSSQENTGLSRGSALLSDNVRTKLAETGIILERLLGTAVNVEWEQDDQGTFQVANLFPASRPPREISPEEVAAAEAKATILCQGGQTVQAGIGAGRVVHVDDETSLADFPAGAVAVARFASPNLAPILQRAAAIITEYGSTAGHLATVAREQRLPAIFSLPHARTLLPPDNEITVIAGEGKVYAGIVDILLQSGEDQTFTPFDREYRTLRRLLRFITPLNLIDPESPGFSPDGCRTFHDIIHFCHEQAVDDLAHFQERRPGLGAIRTDRMQLGVPLDIRVLDIGGAMVNEAKLPFTADKVKSMPFNAFLDGLLLPAAWEHELPSLGLRDIVSAMPKSMNMLSGQGEVMAENLAIVGHDYINISLRLGYHFSVIDAHLGNDDTRNYVYFRFVGGLANIDRRERRAFFIREVLSAMDFKVSVKGDLVIGRRKSAKPKALAAVLHVLGSLTAFSKQRDTALYSDEDVRNLYAIFESSFLVPYRKRIAEVYDASGEYDHA